MTEKFDLSNKAESHFARMFEADRSAKDYDAQFPAYLYDHECGALPWWPPLSQVWQRQGVVIEYDVGRIESRWAEAWALLQAMRADFLATRRRH